MVHSVHEHDLPVIVCEAGQGGHRGIGPAHVHAQADLTEAQSGQLLRTDPGGLQCVGVIDPARACGALAQDIRPVPDRVRIIGTQKLPDLIIRERLI